MGESLNGLKRTMMCGEPREEHVGKKITLMDGFKETESLEHLNLLI